MFNLTKSKNKVHSFQDDDDNVSTTPMEPSLCSIRRFPYSNSTYPLRASGAKPVDNRDGESNISISKAETKESLVFNIKGRSKSDLSASSYDESSSRDSHRFRVNQSGTWEGIKKAESESSKDSEDEDNDEIEILMQERKYGQWTQKLMTAMWLNFAGKLRNPILTFTEIFFPAIVCLMFMLTLWYGNSDSSYQKSEYWNGHMQMRKVNSDSRNLFQDEYTRGLLYSKISRSKIFQHFCLKRKPCQGQLSREKTYHIIYSPKTDFTDTLMANVVKTLNLTAPVYDEKSDHQLIGFENADIAFKHMEKLRTESLRRSLIDPMFPVGINFIIDNQTIELDNRMKLQIPRRLEYAIRRYNPLIANTVDSHPMFNRKASDSRLSPYVYTGFVALQMAIDVSFANLLVSNFHLIGHTVVQGLHVPMKDFAEKVIDHPSLQQFDFPLQLEIRERYKVWIYVVYSVILGYVCSTFSIVKNSIEANDSGALEILKVHGMDGKLPWLASLLNSIAYSCLTSTCLTVTFYFIFFYDELPVSLRYGSNMLVLWCFFVLHGVALKAFSAFLSIFFKKPTLGASSAVMVNLLSFIIPSCLVIHGKITFNFLFYFLPNWCLANGMYYILSFEPQVSGLNWYSLAILGNTDCTFFPVPLSCFMFFIHIILYSSLAICGDQISEKYLGSINLTDLLAFKDGRGKLDLPFFEQDDDEDVRESVVEDHFNETWNGEEDAATWVRNITPPNYNQYLEHEEEEDIGGPSTFEQQPSDWKASLMCRNITKTYPEHEVVLEKLNLNFYRGEITCIIGGNGSGKSTLLHILAGVLKPSTGTVSIFLPSSLNPQSDTEGYSSSVESENEPVFERQGSFETQLLIRDACKLNESEEENQSEDESEKAKNEQNDFDEDDEHYESSDDKSVIEATDLITADDGESHYYNYDRHEDMSSEAEEDEKYIYEAAEDLGKTNYGAYIGFCPQKLMLFQYLSVEEHIRLVCLLHGMLPSEATENYDHLLKMFNLWDIRRAGILSLSVCQQRKLSIAMALVSNPITLILDEPTMDMDVYSANEFWNILRELKQDRTVIVTTSTLEEADRYSDKIGFLSHGKVLCWGSSSFLKSYYTRHTGVHQFLSVAKGDSFLDKQELMNVLFDVPGIQELAVSGMGAGNNELLFSIPPKFRDTSALLENLEEQQEMIGFSKVQLLPVDLLKVFNFLRNDMGVVGESDLAKETFSNANENHAEVDLRQVYLPYTCKHVEQSRSFSTRFHALWKKRIWYSNQKHRCFLMDHVAALGLMFFLCLCADTLLPAAPSSPLRAININVYKKPKVLLYCNDPDHGSVMTKGFQAVMKGADIRMLPFELTLEDALIEIADRKLDSDTLVAFSCATIVTGLYSSNSPISAPISFNIIMNMLLWVISPDRNNPYEIKTLIHPAILFENTASGYTGDFLGLIYGSLFSLIFAMITASKIAFPIMERSSGMKMLQLFTGLSPGLLCNVNLLVDVLINFVLSVIIFVVILLCDLYQDIFTEADEKLVLFLIITIHLCCAAVPYAYAYSTVMSNQNSGFGAMLLIHFITGIFPIAFIFNFAKFLPEIDMRFNLVTYFLHLFPPYSITSALVHYYHRVADRRFCRWVPKESADLCTEYSSVHYDPALRLSSEIKLKLESDLYFPSCCRIFCEPHHICHKPIDILGWNSQQSNSHIWGHLLAMLCQGVFFWVLMMVLEYGVLQDIISTIRRRICGDSEHKSADNDFRENPETDEVRMEREAIDIMVDVDGKIRDDCAIVLHDVSKFIKEQKVVDHVNLVIPYNSITCLLGHDGSGKSSILSLITGHMNTSTGSVFIQGNMSTKGNRTCLQDIGICFEKNIFFRHLTGFQMMELMGKLRGIPQEHNEIEIQMWLSIFGITKDAQDMCLKMSPGTLRKLSLALTLVGNSKILIFDEPTSHLDATMHHSFWNIMKQVQKGGQTIIVTSNSSQDASNAATKVALLGDGQLCTVGTPNFVNSKYNRGVSITVYYLHPSEYTLKSTSAVVLYALKYQLEEWFQTYMSPCEVLANQDNLMIVHVLDPYLRLSHTHDALKTLKEGLAPLISSYTISELTLDEILRQITKNKNLDHLLDGGSDEEEVDEKGIDEKRESLVESGSDSDI